MKDKSSEQILSEASISMAAPLDTHLIKKLKALREKYYSFETLLANHKEELDLYTNLEISSTAGGPSNGSLEARINEFIYSAKREQVFLLQGNSGAGKSLFGTKLALSFWEKYTGKEEDIIALNITLKENKSNAHEIIEYYLTSKKFTEDEITELKYSNSPKIIFFDGYDEMNVEQNIYEINRLHEWRNLKIIISCRSNVLYSNHQSLFMVCSPYTSCYDQESLQEGHILPFSREKRNDYIRKYVNLKKLQLLGWDTNTIIKNIDNLPELSEITRDPLLLKLMLEILPGIKSEKIPLIKRYDLYNIFINKCFERETNRNEVSDLSANLNNKNITVQIKRSVLNTYCQKLALSLFKGTYDIDYKEKTLHEIMRIIYDNTPENLDEPLNSGSNLFIKLSKDKKTFIHKSFEEFFVASAIIEELTEYSSYLGEFDKLENALNTVNEQKLKILNILSLPQLDSDRSVIFFIADKVRGDEILQNTLFDIISLTKTSAFRTGKAYEQAAANAATILCYAKVPFNHRNLKGIRIPGADLYGALLDQTDLRYADLSKVNLRQAWLRGTKLDFAILKDTTFEEHPYFVMDSSKTALSGDYSKLATITEGNKVKIYDASDFNGKFGIKYEAALKDISFNRDGTKILALTTDNIILIHDSLTGEKLYELKDFREKITSVTFNDTYAIFGFENGGLQLYELKYGGIIEILSSVNPHQNNIRVIALSSDESKIAIGDMKGKVSIWDIKNITDIKLIGTIDPYQTCINSISWRHEDRKVAICADDPKVTIYQINNNDIALIHNMHAHTKNVKTLAFNHDGSKIVTGGEDETVRLWDTHSGQHLHVMQGHTGCIHKTWFSTDRKTIKSIGNDLTLRTWEISQYRPNYRINGHSGDVLDMKFNPDSSRIVTVSEDKTLRLWDTKTGKELSVFRGHESHITTVDISPDNKKIISGSKNDLIIWNTENPTLFNKIAQDDKTIKVVKFNKDGQLIVIGGFKNNGRGYITVLNTETYEILHEIDDSIGVTSINYNFTGDLFISGHANGKLVIRNSNNYDEIIGQISPEDNNPITCISFNQANSFIITGHADGMLKLWNRELKLLKSLKAHNDAINSLSLSPDNSIIATGSSDRTICLWDSNLDHCVQSISGYSVIVNSVQFSHDGKVLLTNSRRGTRLWNVHDGRLKDLFYAINPGFLHIASVSFYGTRDLSDDNKKLLTQRNEACKKIIDKGEHKLPPLLLISEDKNLKALHLQDPFILFSKRKEFDISNAYQLSRLSVLIYEPLLENIRNVVTKIWDLKVVDTIEKHNGSLRAMILAKDDNIIVVFRGTENNLNTNIKVHNWTTNIDCRKSGITLMDGAVHNGFFWAAETLWKELSDKLSALPKDKTIWFTGHSLGGAMATIAAARYSTLIHSDQKEQVRVYTIGQPRVGDSVFKENYNACLPYSYPIISKGDIVPCAPPARFGYQHVGSFRYICNEGFLYNDSHYAATDYAKEYDRQKSSNERDKYVADKIEKRIKERVFEIAKSTYLPTLNINDHKKYDYVKQLRNLQSKFFDPNASMTNDSTLAARLEEEMTNRERSSCCSIM